MRALKLAISATVISVLSTASYATCNISINSKEHLKEQVVFISNSSDNYIYLVFQDNRYPRRFELYKTSDCSSISSGEVSSSKINATLSSRGFLKKEIASWPLETITPDYSNILRINEVVEPGVFGGTYLKVDTFSNVDQSIVKKLTSIMALGADFSESIYSDILKITNKESLDNSYILSAIKLYVRDDESRAVVLVQNLSKIIDAISKKNKQAAVQIAKIYATQEKTFIKSAPVLHSLLIGREKLLEYRAVLAADQSEESVAASIFKYKNEGYDPEGLVSESIARIRPYLYKKYLTAFNSAATEADWEVFIKQHKYTDFDNLIPRAQAKLTELTKRRKEKERLEWIASYKREFAAANSISELEDFIRKYTSDDPANLVSAAKTKLSIAQAKETEQNRLAEIERQRRNDAACARLYIGKPVSFSVSVCGALFTRCWNVIVKGQIVGIGNGVASARLTESYSYGGLKYGSVHEERCDTF